MMGTPEYREHSFVESRVPVDLNKLLANRLNDENYSVVHANTVIPTHDAVVTCNNGIILMERIGKPLSGFLWLPGGRIQRGVPTEISLARAVKRECGLDISDLQFAGLERAFIPEDPLGHGKGTDTIGPVFYAIGSGNLKLDVDGNHNKPILYTVENYAGVRDKLHPFVQKYTDVAIGRIASTR
jgi:colanic acid biosynthesis protein WcaH